MRLIKQMREDGERVRAWKAAKEKEVAQLRQAERKQVRMKHWSLINW